jgi:hypothetical protein
MIKNLHRFHSKRPHTITKMDDNINMGGTIHVEEQRMIVVKPVLRGQLWDKEKVAL